MQTFKYETHAHTSQASKCSKITAEQLVDFYKARGYAGLFITDHFLNGNTTVSKELPWDESINLFCEGYLSAYNHGQKIGLDVFLGWEYSYNGTDLLTYGLDINWLLNHPNLLKLSVNEYCDFVHIEGGFIVHAHPFREAGYIDMIRLLPRKVDAVEVINAERTDFENKMAQEYAKNYELPSFAGSDIHASDRKRLCGVELPKKLESADGLRKAVLSGRCTIFDNSII